MNIGNPFVFGIIGDRVKEWNDNKSSNDGYFALCVYSEVFPKTVVRTPLDAALKEVLATLKSIPEDDNLSLLDYPTLFNTLYYRVYPMDGEKDYRFLLSPLSMEGENFRVFVVKGKGETVVVGTEFVLDGERINFDETKVCGMRVSEDEMKSIIDGIDTVLCRQAY